MKVESLEPVHVTTYLVTGQIQYLFRSRIYGEFYARVEKNSGFTLSSTEILKALTSDPATALIKARNLEKAYEEIVLYWKDKLPTQPHPEILLE